MSEPIEVTNLMANPKPVNISAWRAGPGKDISISMSDGWMQVTNNTKSHDCYVYARIQLPAGAWRYGAGLGAPTGGFAANELRFIRLNPIQEMQYASWDGTPGRIVTPANTLETAAQVELRIMVGPNAGDAVRVRRLLIMTDADYTAMHDDGVEWFDGDTYPRNSGGGYPPSRYRAYPHLDCEVCA